MISFLIFLFIINRIMLRPLKSTMNERDGYMEKIRLDIAAAAEKLQSMTKSLQKKETKARNEALGIQSELEASGNMEADGILHATLEEIELIKDQNKAKIDAQIAEARKHLQKESQVLAVDIMEKMLERRLIP
ncbi:MAG: ATP synthase F0 subunit B [Proteobacteria bacterium]|nr:ATP synthase F0 subunit B [Pseudomonadota bacterium]